MSSADRRRSRLVRGSAVAAGVLTAAAAVAVATGVSLRLPDNDQAEASSDVPPATAQVTRQTLVDTQTETGELGYGSAAPVRTRLAGTVTALPPVGSTVERGAAIYDIDDTPVVLLYGSLPAYRALSPGLDGTDVAQLEENLSALGYDGFTVDDEYTWATATAVKEWQDDLGLPKTGTVDLGRVVFGPGPVRVDSHEAAVGDAVQPGQDVVTHTGSTRVIVVELDTTDQRPAVEEAAVSVTLPDGSSVPGTIADATTVVDDSGGDGGQGGDAQPVTKIQVTIALDNADAVVDLDQASVQVAFTTSQREDVLTVPVAALLALAEGGYGVEVVEGTSTRIVAVETGMFAGGQVEVSGADLTEGMTVGMPS